MGARGTGELSELHVVEFAKMGADGSIGSLPRSIAAIGILTASYLKPNLTDAPAINLENLFRSQSPIPDQVAGPAFSTPSM